MAEVKGMECPNPECRHKCLSDYDEDYNPNDQFFKLPIEMKRVMSDYYRGDTMADIFACPECHLLFIGNLR
jgi:hypothetical protein